MKQHFKKIIVETRKGILSNFSGLVRLFYKYFWTPKTGSLDDFFFNYSKKVDNFYFIQVGSNDGFQNDPLYKFIKLFNWKGILLEPQKKAFDSLTKVYKKDNVIPVNKAISHNTENRFLYKLGFTDSRWASGISSFNKDHLEQKIADGYVEKKCKKEGIIPPENKDAWIVKETVYCTTFEELIDAYQISKLDLLQIDTEGFDFEVIKLLDFSLLKPGAIVYEHESLSLEDQKNCIEYLTKSGYNVNQFGRDSVAISPTI